MELAEKLDALRLKFPECRTVAFADVSTGMVLCNSASEDLLQEQLDKLSVRGVEALVGSVAKCAAGLMPESCQDDLLQAIMIETHVVGIYLRSASNPVDGLFCICTPRIDLAAFNAAARALLSQIGSDA